MLDTINLSLPEILSLIGLIQCVFLLVYIGMRIARIPHAFIAFMYFFGLAAAFFLDFGYDTIGHEIYYYYYLHWFAWFLGPPLSVLFILQVANPSKRLDFRDYWVLLIPPLCFSLSLTASVEMQACEGTEICDELKALLNVTGLIASAMCLLIVFSRKNLLTKLRRQRLGRERYWLVLVLVCLNSLVLLVLMASLLDYITLDQAGLIRTILGLAFIYLVSTSLLRLYPKAANSKPLPVSESFSESEMYLANRMEHLIYVDKVYQEASYSRSDLAKECGVSEVMVSKVLNSHFKKTLPQLFNTLRVEEATKLLVDTNATMAVIAGEVGFNSLPSFNRVFKDIAGVSPSAYRKRQS